MAGFVWGAGGAQLTPEQIAAQQKVAQALIEKGSDTSPVQHWSQGANRVLQGLMGGYDARVADEATKANAEENKVLIASLLSGGTAPVAGTTSPAPIASTPPQMSGGLPQPMAPSVAGKIYRNDEPSPLDPPQGKDRDLAIRTVFGEDPGASASGVANVIRNRAVAGNYGGDTVGGVVLAKNQFEPWNNPTARARMEGLDQNSPTYQRLGKIVDDAWMGTNDPTNGATHFFSPTAQAALGRPVPKWGTGAGQDIGTHRFFGGAQPTATAAADPAAIPPAAAPAQYIAPGTGEVIAPATPAAKPSINPAAVYAIMANPRASESTQKVAALMLQHQMAQQGVTHVDAGNAIIVLDKQGNEVRRLPKGEPNKGPEFGVISKVDGEEVYGWRDPRTQAVTPYTPTGSASPASNMVLGPDGKLAPIPAGVDRKLYKTEMTKIVADAAGGKKTETQANSENFGNRMEDSERNLAGFEPAVAQNGWGTWKDRVLRGATDAPYSPLPRGATNWAVSNDYQRFDQAKSQWITAKLRKESGAAIGKEEFEREDREFFPQAGDSADVIAQKQQARKVAVEGMKKGAGPGYKSPTPPAAVGEAPKGIDQNVWKHMTPEERALWK